MFGEARWFEDYVPGTVHAFGAERVDEDEVLAFGQRFDPHAMHTDPEAARHTEFGGVIASGWHTASLAMRIYATHYLSPASSIVSPGVDEVRWLLPVRPGDVLSLRVIVLDARPSTSKPDRGIVRSRVEVLNQHGEVAMTFTGLNFIRRRPARP